MEGGVATDERIKLEFYSVEDSVLILASWDEDEDTQLEAEVLAKYFALRCGTL